MKSMYRGSPVPGTLNTVSSDPTKCHSVPSSICEKIDNSMVACQAPSICVYCVPQAACQTFLCLPPVTQHCWPRKSQANITRYCRLTPSDKPRLPNTAPVTKKGVAPLLFHSFLTVPISSLLYLPSPLRFLTFFDFFFSVDLKFLT